MFKEDLELREAVFKKMGWSQTEYKPKHNKPIVLYGMWKSKTATAEFFKLPPIETSWEVCAKYLVPFMRGKGWGLFINLDEPDGAEGDYLNWGRNDKSPFAVGANIINDNIALAACQAFLEVKL